MIEDHENSPEFKTGQKSGLFYRHHDPLIEAYEKYIYDENGMRIKDEISPNHKIISDFYSHFVDEIITYLLGNGVIFDNPEIKKQLGNSFDYDVMQVALYAANDGEGYALVDKDRIFPMCKACQLEGNEPYFIPLKDERSGKVMAGISYWRLCEGKPLNVTFYRVEGYTEFTEYTEGEGENRKQNLRVVEGRKNVPYKFEMLSNEAEGEYQIQADNYSELPIARMGYINNQSMIVNNDTILTTYNLIVSGYANKVDWDILYWIINNADGMNSQDDRNFIISVLKDHVMHTSGDATAQPYQISIDADSREKLLDRLEALLYRNFSLVDVTKNNANMTATEIKNSYKPLNRICDKIEKYVSQFIRDVLRINGFDENEPFHFSRAVEYNFSEQVNAIVSAAPYIGRKAATKMIVTAAGMTDELENIEADLAAEEMDSVFGSPDGENSVDIADSIADKVINAIKDFFKRIFKIKDDEPINIDESEENNAARTDTN